MQYKFDEVFGARNVRLDPQRIGEELQELYEREGVLTHNMVTEHARSRRTECHKAFEWNDVEAADRWRKDQARKLIGGVRVRRGGKMVKAFVTLEGAKGYYSFDDVMADAELRDTHLRDAFKKLTSLQSRYEHLKELTKVFAEADKAKAKHRKQSA